MSSVILELSQAEAQNVNVNGDYNISLPQNSDLLLEAGDSIQLKNVFIDTESQSSQKIVIKDDITATLDFIYYYVYSRTGQLTPYNPLGVSPAPAAISIDADPFVLCRDVSGPDLVQLTQVNLGNDTQVNKVFNWEINYTDSQGDTRTAHFYQQEINAYELLTPTVSIIFDSNSPIVLKTTQAFIFDPSKPLSRGSPLDPSQFPTVAEKTKTPVSTTTPHFEPVIGFVEIKVSKGNYSPALLTKEINRQLQLAGANGQQNGYLANNAFLREFGNGSSFLVRQDGNEIIEISGKLIAGASQVDLEFLTDTNQFSWNFIHMPYFTTPTTDAPGQPAIGYIANQANSEYYTVTKNSGIAFTSLFSKFSDGTSADLWTTILGFDVSTNNILVANQVKTLTGYNGVPTLQSVVITPKLTDGTNTTGGFLPLSAQVNRTALTAPEWWQPAITTGPIAGVPFLSTSTDTVNILGSQDTLSNSEFSYGYFLVEIQGNFKTNYYSNQKSPNIMAIVSRYYELNSFTSGTEGDSLVYTHVGDPITLSSFGVRIMTPQKVVADNLGDNTAVFLEIVRNSQE